VLARPVEAARGRRARRNGSDSSPPRLVLRFALYTGIGLTVAAGAILLFVRHHERGRAESTARLYTHFVAASIAPDRLRPADFMHPVSEQRRRYLDRLFAERVLVHDGLRVELYGPGGLVTYSTRRSRIGQLAHETNRLADAFAGGVSGAVEPLDPGEQGSAEALKAYAGVRFGSEGSEPQGVLSVARDYGPTARAGRNALLPVVGVLELVLLLLFVALFPMLRRVTKRLETHVEEVEYRALHDALTGLPNRAFFHERVEQALETGRRDGTGAAVLLLDVDEFREINDTLGHGSGDHLLQELASRLRRVAGDGELVARLGGDEFAVLVPSLPAGTNVHQASVERVRRAFDEPVVVEGLSLDTRASIGVAVFPTHGDDAETLVRRADIAMYESKKTRTPTEYAPASDVHSPARLALLGDLRRAIQNGELHLHYQPQVDLLTGAVRGVEALVRWHHPEHGPVAPDTFVPLAERGGLVRSLTRLVLETAVEHCAMWRNDGWDVHVAVNITGADVSDLRFPDEVRRSLTRWNLDASALELEITEGSILSDRGRVDAVLLALSELGVRIAIDDFGSGYSSLAHLKRLPLDVLKIDKLFVLNMTSDENDALIVQSTIDLAHNLGLAVVAEGVEDDLTWRRLVELRCDTAQGYHTSRPLPAAEVGRWLRERPRPLVAVQDAGRAA
jgi:diguanylate cyclase (GGDEF)-like protein